MAGHLTGIGAAKRGAATIGGHLLERRAPDARGSAYGITRSSAAGVRSGKWNRADSTVVRIFSLWR
jgi:hypothetical protein